MGANTHCVLAQQRGGEGETVSAGIAYGFRDDGFGGYVAEGHMHGTKNSLREVMEWKMGEMAKLRGIKFRRIDYRIEELSIPMDHYGACLAVLMFPACRMYGVIVCPRCKRAKGGDMKQKTTTCACGLDMRTAASRMPARADTAQDL